jgi:hypothetical protein
MAKDLRPAAGFGQGGQAPALANRSRSNFGPSETLKAAAQLFLASPEQLQAAKAAGLIGKGASENGSPVEDALVTNDVIERARGLFMPHHIKRQAEHEAHLERARAAARGPEEQQTAAADLTSKSDEELAALAEAVQTAQEARWDAQYQQDNEPDENIFGAEDPYSPEEAQDELDPAALYGDVDTWDEWDDGDAEFQTDLTTEEE